MQDRCGTVGEHDCDDTGDTRKLLLIPFGVKVGLWEPERWLEL